MNADEKLISALLSGEAKTKEKAKRLAES